MNRAAIFTLAILTVISSLPVVESGTITDNSPSAGLRRYREDFQNLTTGSTPTDSWYNVTTAGTGTQFVNSAKMWQTEDTAAAYAVQLNNLAVGADLCLAGQSLTFSGSVPDLAVTTQAEYRVQSGTVSSSASPTNSAGIRFTGIVASTVSLVQFFLHDSSGAEIVSSTTGTLNAGASFTTTISQMACPNLASVLFTNAGLGAASVSLTGDSPFTGTFNEWSVAHTAGAVSTVLTADDYDWQGILMPAPTITNISPAGGATPGGNTVTVTGTNFVSGAQVTVDGVATNETFVSATQITFVAPLHAAGATSVIVTNPDGRASNAATYTYAALPTPVILFVVPDIGFTAGGESVQIQGNNFRDPTVYFDGVAAQTVSYYNNRVNVTTPPHAEGIVNVTVTNGDDLQSATLTNGYEYCATTDTDTDGVPDCVDNCPTDFNPSQRDFDSDGAGNACAIVGGSGIGEVLSEDFQDDTLGDNSPSEDWYTFGGNTGAVYASPQTGSQVYRIPTSQVSTFTTQVDICATGGLTFNVFLESFSNNANPPKVLLVNSTTGATTTNAVWDEMIAAVTPAGFSGLRLTAWNSTNGAAQTAGPFTVDNTQMVRLTHTITCNSLEASGTGALSNGYSVNANAPGTFSNSLNQIQFYAGASGSMQVDNITIQPTGETQSPWDSEPVANITGFDVDQFGQLAITRHDNGPTIQVYDGFSLEPGNDENTDCMRFGGVDAMTARNGESLVSYFDCDSVDESLVISLKIRDRNLDAPSGQITSIDAKDAFGPQGFLAGDQDQQIELSDVGTFPYDFSRTGTQSSCVGGCGATGGAWAFSDTEGGIGVFTYETRDQDFDESRSARAIIKSGASASVSELCAAFDTTTNPPRDLIYGSATGVNVQGFKVNYGTVGGGRGIEVSLTNIFSGSHPETLSAQIGCGREFLVTISAGNVYLWNVANGSRTLMHTSPDLGFVGMDPDGLQFAFVDGDEIILMQLDGEIAARFLKPEPFITKVILRNQGNALYLSGEAGIYYIDATPYSQYGNVSYNPFVDIDGDGLAGFEDTDIDGDGVPNTTDPDIDGDGQCNGSESLPAGTAGAANGCTGGDTDDDGDGLPDTIDGQPGGLGTGTANPGVVPAGGDTGQGLFGFSRTVSILGALALILALAFAGYVFTAGRDSRKED